MRYAITIHFPSCTTRYPHCFEIASIKHNGRVYLFACDMTESQRDDWVVALCRAVCGLQPQQEREITAPVDKGGCVHLRVGATGEYSKGWIHLQGHTLHIHNKVRNISLYTGGQM